jgi:hypothetical protein
MNSWPYIVKSALNYEAQDKAWHNDSAICRCDHCLAEATRISSIRAGMFR